MAQSTLTQFQILPRPRWRGFSFALHLLRVQGFYFAILQYSPMQAFIARFVPLMQLYRTLCKTAHRALQWHSLRFTTFYRQHYQTDKCEYNAACAAPDARTLCRPAQPPYYNNVYKVRSCYGSMQTVQQIADHASPAGSRCFPRPAAGGLAPGQRSGRAIWHPPPGGAV